MHKIFVTEGIVLAKRAIGESNSLIVLLSPELGLVRASVRSARKEASKLRYGIEMLTTARFSLVRGRGEWKLTGVERVSHACSPERAVARMLAGKVSRLLLRLLQGEEQVAGLFETVREGLRCLAHIENDADVEEIECVLVLRILAHLGYVPQTPELGPFMSLSPAGEFFPLELSAQVRASRTKLIRTINESLSATGL